MVGVLCIVSIIGVTLFAGLIHYYVSERSFRDWNWDDLFVGGVETIMGAFVIVLVSLFIYGLGLLILTALK